ncbi:MAG: hypothetical protein [Caudoviricetes sp.]|nr:MAG: hypothetical protein [Caudoviricetes sp.]
MQVHIVFERDTYDGSPVTVEVYLNKDSALTAAKSRWDAYVETMEVEDAEV